MAKKKQQPEPVEKIFEVIPAIYDQLNWGVGWENEDRAELDTLALTAVYQLGYTEAEGNTLIPKDTILHETLNSFKGNSDNLKAFLFLDTVYNGSMFVGKPQPGNEHIIAPVKGTLVIIKGYEYYFANTWSVKRRVLELIF